mmetsp:Transcript_10727/g.27106  ORF Transcript_10727/g.27106 Transcript_10727/m.27106 type:complete len:636 (-) Transcript_10727:1627-3534(-)
METTDISRLVSDLQGLAISPSGSETSLPSLQQLYRVGLVLFRILQQKRSDQKSIDSDSVVAAYKEVIESLPDSSIQSLFADLRRALQTINHSHTNVQDLGLAVQSIQGLMGAFSDSDSQTCRKNESNSRLCRVVYESAWISTLSSIYDRFIVFEKQHNGELTQKELESTQQGILSCLSRLLLDGLILNESSTIQLEESLLDAIRCMEEASTDVLRDLQDWQTKHEPFQRNLEESLRSINMANDDDDETLEKAQQREYILSMLESARAEPSSMAIPIVGSETPKTTRVAPKKPPPPAKETELDRRVKQVLHILPHFGEGFAEVALGLHKGDVEATVATLLNHPTDGSAASSNYPKALSVLDPKLPRRKREFKTYQTQEEEAQSAEEARTNVKERMALEEKQRQDQYEALVVVTSQQEEQQRQQQQQPKTTASPLPEKQLTRKELRQQKLKQLRKRSEYDDDYDDQYDEIDIKLGAADDGFTSDNMTFEQVKLYNQVLQEDESDTAFWESNRNQNKTKNAAREKKFGPDKIKGGRVIGADGKIVRKPGGAKKKKSNNNNNNNNATASGQQNNNNSNSNKGSGGNPKASNNSNSSNNNNPTTNNGNKKKPKTKPRTDNRVNRQRDRKMKKQGAFGVQD